MTTVSESTFVAALKDLTFTLQQREEAGLNEIIDPECIGQILSIPAILDDSNVLEMCELCTQILDTLGDIRNHRAKDDAESLRAIEHHLKVMYQNPLGSDDNIFKNLDYVLLTKSHHIARMAEAVESFSGY